MEEKGSVHTFHLKPKKGTLTHIILQLAAIGLFSCTLESVTGANINQYNEVNNSHVVNLARYKRSLTPDPSKYDLDIEKVKDFMDYLVICYNYDYLSNLNPNEYTGMAFYDEKQNKVDDLGILRIDARFEVRETIRTDETLIHSEINEFRAYGGDERVSTLSYGYDVTDSFTFKFGEKVSVKAGFKVLTLAALEVTTELNLEQTYTKTKMHKLTAPSQVTTVKAGHKKTVTYSVYKGDSTLKGVLRVRIDPDQIIHTWVLKNKLLNSHSREFTFSGLVHAVKEKGYGHLFNSNSLITKELNNYYLNVPAELQSNTNRLEVAFSGDIPL